MNISLGHLANKMSEFISWERDSKNKGERGWDLVAHPLTQVIGEEALVDILDLSEVAWTCWGVSTPRSGLGLRLSLIHI